MSISSHQFGSAARLTLAVAAVLATACGTGEPRTDAERLARGRDILERMSTKLGSAQSFGVSTREVRDQVGSSGQPKVVTVVRESIIRRPDRFYFKTSGDVQNEGWYDGVGLTLAVHADKVFAQARMPETLDKVLDVRALRGSDAGRRFLLLVTGEGAPCRFDDRWVGRPRSGRWCSRPIIWRSRTRV
jgi:hypothetical protein